MPSSILDQLAHSLGRKDQEPNIALAERICKTSDQKAVTELIVLMNHKSTPIRHDAIKVLYEIGERKPLFIIDYHKDFLKLLERI